MIAESCSHFKCFVGKYYGGPGDSTHLKFDWDTATVSPGTLMLWVCKTRLVY